MEISFFRQYLDKIKSKYGDYGTVTQISRSSREGLFIMCMKEGKKYIYNNTTLVFEQ